MALWLEPVSAPLPQSPPNASLHRPSFGNRAFASHHRARFPRLPPRRDWPSRRARPHYRELWRVPQPPSPGRIGVDEVGLAQGYWFACSTFFLLHCASPDCLRLIGHTYRSLRSLRSVFWFTLGCWSLTSGGSCTFESTGYTNGCGKYIFVTHQGREMQKVCSVYGTSGPQMRYELIYRCPCCVLMSGMSYPCLRSAPLVPALSNDDDMGDLSSNSLFVPELSAVVPEIEVWRSK